MSEIGVASPPNTGEDLAIPQLPSSLGCLSVLKSLELAALIEEEPALGKPDDVITIGNWKIYARDRDNRNDPDRKIPQYGYVPKSYFSNLYLRNSINSAYDSAGLPEQLFTLVGLKPDAHSFGDVIEAMRARTETGEWKLDTFSYNAALALISQVHNKRQLEFETITLPPMLKDTRKRLNNAVKRGDLPTYLIERFDTRISQSNLLLDDGFRTVAMGLHGEYIPVGQEGTIILEDHLGRLWPTFKHECGHMLEGTNSDYTKKGINRAFPDHPHVGRALREAMGEVFLSALMGDKPIIGLDPTAGLRDKDNTYPGFRFMLYKLCTSGQRPIDLKKFLDSNYTEDDQEQAAHSTLLAAIQKAFPDHPALIDNLENLLQNNFNNLIGNANEFVTFFYEIEKHYNRKCKLGNVAFKFALATFNEVRRVYGRKWRPKTNKPLSDTALC